MANTTYKLMKFPNELHFVALKLQYGSMATYSRSPCFGLDGKSAMLPTIANLHNPKFFSVSFDASDRDRAILIAEAESMEALKLKVAYLFL